MDTLIKQAQQADLSLEQQAELVETNNLSVREALLLNPSTHSQILSILQASALNTGEEQLAGFRLREVNIETVLEVADDPDTHPLVLDYILLTYGQEDDWVLENLAYNETSSPELLEKIAEMTINEGVLAGLAKNPHSPDAVLVKIEDHHDWRIRADLFENPNLQPKFFRSGAGDIEYEVREVVAYHPDTPLDVLKLLVNDEEPSVREFVLNNPSYRP